MDKGVLITLIVVLLFLFLGGYLGYVFKQKGKEAAIKEAKAIAYKLMVLAEKKYSDGQGRLKMDFVLDRFWPQVPAPFKLLITRADAEAFLQTIYEELRGYVDNKPG